MAMETIEQFQERRKHGHDRVLASDNLQIKRFMALDTACYRDGALTGKTKELLGLTASMVLRCNDCIDYHLVQCVQSGFTQEELEEAMNVALIVGGSIVIPHLRHALLHLDQLKSAQDGQTNISGSSRPQE